MPRWGLGLCESLSNPKKETSLGAHRVEAWGGAGMIHDGGSCGESKMDESPIDFKVTDKKLLLVCLPGYRGPPRWGLE